ncbi:NADP-dependent malic enzyme [Glycine soja]
MNQVKVHMVHVGMRSCGIRLSNLLIFLLMQLRTTTPNEFLLEYYDLMHEFMTAVKQNYGEKVLVQFEDFANDDAFELLAKYGTTHLVFNDDIQAGTGIAQLIALEMSKQTKAPIEESRKKIWLVDSKVIKPTVLIGSSGVGRTFTKEVVEAMTSNNDKPLILALPNPTSQSECTAEEAYQWREVKKLMKLRTRWNKALDIAAVSRCSTSNFDSDKSETALSKWARPRTMAAKVEKGLSKDDKAQKLPLRHWLEAVSLYIDPHNRYGHNLHLYYAVGFNSQSSQPFFY